MARKSKRRGDQENFARIPVSVLESLAVTTLNHAAFKVLVVLASQWRGGNNGTLALTEVYARKFGLSGRDTLYRSLRELERRGLIVRTRQGMKSKRLFTLWALGWESITHRDGQPLDTPEPKNNSRWLKWRPSVPTVGSDRAQDSAEIHTDGRESTVPTIGSDEPVSVPMLPDRLPVSVPTIGNTSRVLEGATAGSTGSASVPAPDSIPNPLPKAGGRISKLDERIRKARSYLAIDPAADNGKLSSMYQLDDEQIQQARARA